MIDRSHFLNFSCGLSIAWPVRDPFYLIPLRTLDVTYGNTFIFVRFWALSPFPYVGTHFGLPASLRAQPPGAPGGRHEADTISNSSTREAI